MVICTIWQSHYNNQGALKYRCSIYNYENHPLYRWKNMAETCSSSCIQLHTWYHSSQCIWISLYVGALENPKNFRIGFTPNNMHKNAVCTFFKWGCLYSCKFKYLTYCSFGSSFNMITAHDSQLGTLSSFNQAISMDRLTVKGSLMQCLFLMALVLALLSACCWRS